MCAKYAKLCQIPPGALEFSLMQWTELPLKVIVCYVVIEEGRGRGMLDLSQQAEISVGIAGYNEE